MSETPAKPRQVPFWLVLSLMANMMLVGLFAGLLLRRPPPPQGPPDGSPRIEWVSRDGDERRQIAVVMRTAFEASEGERSERVAARAALAEALGKEPYDADAVRAAFAGLRRADEAVHAATHEKMVEQFASLPVDERLHMADIVSRGPGDFLARRGMRKGERVFIRKLEDGRMEHVIEEHEFVREGDED
ncbi:MAG: periplasmic heavy metal sensor [Hyphomonas sp.]|uniref:periplasmic heavy metal sensor n=1 Tax=Hyphomonas sp. TaxID=87 RepID=UPI003527FB5A